MTGFVEVRPYAELNAFVAPECRGIATCRPYRPHQTVKDVVEAMGIPHTEIDLIVVDGEPVDFAYRPHPGDRIAVYPVFEALGIEALARLRPAPLRDPRFVVDVNVGKLARLLRLLGFDVIWSSSADDATLARVSRDDQRILLTRDRGLLARRVITHGLYVHSADPVEQVVEVVQRLDLAGRFAPFTRCLRCNGPLVDVPKADILE
ncbi:Mut7-C RNAse domain-containing protein, partial [Rhodococcus chondri]